MLLHDKTRRATECERWSGILTFQFLLHLGCAVLELRLVARQFLVVLLQVTTLCGHTAIPLLEAGYFSF